MPTAWIEINHVDVSLGGRSVLRDISWRIAPGEHWMVVGDNGAGKSTLFRLLRGEVWPDPQSTGAITYNMDGRGFTQHRSRVPENIAYLSSEKQEAYHRHGWNMEGIQVILSGLTDTVWYQGEPDPSDWQIAQHIIELLDIRDLVTKDTLAMSPGELRKILLARALVSAPRCLILDEFCNGLDFPSRNYLLHVVDTIAALGVQILYSTHRSEEVIPSITHALMIKEGRIVAQGKKEIVRIASVAWNDRTQKSRSAPENAMTNRAPLIGLHNASVFMNGVPVLRDLSWEMDSSQNWAILGENGSGKSTLLRLILGEVSPLHGTTVSRFGSDVWTSLWDIRRRIGYLSSEFQSNYIPSTTGRDIVLSGFFGSVGLYTEATEEQQARAQEIITQLGLVDWSDRRLDTLSYGQARKFLMARALVHQPEILILDEACNGLDIASRKDLLTLLETLTHTTATRVIMVTHHLEELIPAIGHVVLLRRGSILDSGPREQVLHPARLRNAFPERKPMQEIPHYPIRALGDGRTL